MGTAAEEVPSAVPGLLPPRPTLEVLPHCRGGGGATSYPRAPKPGPAVGDDGDGYKPVDPAGLGALDQPPDQLPGPVSNPRAATVPRQRSHIAGPVQLHPPR